MQHKLFTDAGNGEGGALAALGRLDPDIARILDSHGPPPDRSLPASFDTLARAIVGKPKWLLCDEPTSSLDDHNAHEVMALLQEEAQQAGTSLIVVTHDHRVRQHIKGHIVELGGQS